MNEQAEELTLGDAIAHWNEYDDQRDHEKNGEPDPADGPSIAEAAADDRRWDLERYGE